jgi:hypothetical protein
VSKDIAYVPGYVRTQFSCTGKLVEGNNSVTDTQALTPPSEGPRIDIATAARFLQAYATAWAGRHPVTALVRHPSGALGYVRGGTGVTLVRGATVAEGVRYGAPVAGETPTSALVADAAAVLGRLVGRMVADLAHALVLAGFDLRTVILPAYLQVPVQLLPNKS